MPLVELTAILELKNIVDKFASSEYKDLYDDIEIDSEFEETRSTVQYGLNKQSQWNLERINDDVTKKAINLLKSHKKDALYVMSSEYYHNSPPQYLGYLMSNP